MQLFGPAHETLVSNGVTGSPRNFSYFGVGACCVVHVVPSQRSTNGPPTWSPGSSWLPTAKQLVVVGQETPLSVWVVEPPAAAAGRIVHAAPFQCSMSARILVPALYLPTAKQLVADGQSTALKNEMDPCFRGAIALHLWPFQRFAMGV